MVNFRESFPRELVNKINYLLKSEKRLTTGKTVDLQLIEICAAQNNDD